MRTIWFLLFVPLLLLACGGSSDVPAAPAPDTARLSPRVVPPPLAGPILYWEAYAFVNPVPGGQHEPLHFWSGGSEAPDWDIPLTEGGTYGVDLTLDTGTPGHGCLVLPNHHLVTLTPGEQTLWTPEVTTYCQVMP